jgi:hypothetical protein
MRDAGIYKRHENLSFDFARQLRANRADRQFAGLTPEQGQALLDQNTTRDLKRAASTAICRLRRVDTEFRRRSEPSGVTQHRAVELYERDQQVLPLFCVETLFGHGLAEAILRKTPGSPGDVKALSGASEDGLHLVGAAYCDVFTCDRATSNTLGGIRAKLGLRPEFAARGYPGGLGAFVADLMATWSQ